MHPVYEAWQNKIHFMLFTVIVKVFAWHIEGPNISQYIEGPVQQRICETRWGQSILKYF
jgi:hypothetical protein